MSVADKIASMSTHKQSDLDIRKSIRETGHFCVEGMDRDAITSLMRISGSLNSRPFLLAEEGTVQVDIEAREKYEDGHHYWDINCVFSYRPEGWQPKPMNAGFFQRDKQGVINPVLEVPEVAVIVDGVAFDCFEKCDFDTHFGNITFGGD